MRPTWLICAREFRAYFLTPLGYGLVAALLCLHGLYFNVTLLQGEHSSYEVVQGYFFQSSGFVAAVAVLVTMRAFAEERQTGTAMLLLTAPLPEWQLVLGKFLGAFGFLCVYIALSAYMPLLIMVNGAVTLGHLVAGYVGLLALGAVVTAIGTLTSALSNSQLLAAVLAASIVALLFACWVVAGAVQGVLGEAIAYLDLMLSHYLSFSRGVIKLSTLVYYASLVYLALLAASVALRLRRWGA